MRRRLATLGWPVLAGSGAVLPLLAVLAGGHVLAWRDTSQLHVPYRGVVVGALRSFQLPTWSPWEATGQPLLAQGLHTVLHPVSVVLAFLTPSIDALLVAFVLAAALGTWLAARELEASPPAACLAALAFSLSGYTLGMTANLVYLAGVATGPWVVAGFVAAARRPLGWLAAAGATASLALSGDVGSLIAFSAIGGALAWRGSGWLGLRRTAGGAALGLALAAVQLVPSWSYFAETTRGAGLMDAESFGRWALSPSRLPELVVPGLFTGVPRSYVAPVFAAMAGQGVDGFPFAPSIFVGATVLLLAVFGAIRRVEARWLLAMAAFLLWLALGHHLWSQQLLSGVPVWGVLRYWEKMVGPLTLCLALAAGLGADSMDQAGLRWQVVRVGSAAAVLSILGVLSLTAWDGLTLGLASEVAHLARAQLAFGLGHAAATLAAMAALCWLVPSRWPGAVVPALAGLIWVQAVAASPFALHVGDPLVTTVGPPSLQAPAPGPRIAAPLGFNPSQGSGGLDAIDLLQASEARSARPSTNVARGLDALATYTGLNSVRWELVLGSRELFWPLSRRYATTHVLARPPETPAEQAALAAATAGATGFTALDGGRLLAWEVPHRDWASFASDAVAARDLRTAAALLGAAVEAGRGTVVVESSAASFPVAPGRVLGLQRSPQRVVIDGESAADGLLVVNDAFAPGWIASMDGRPVELLPADVLVRAVRWPAGRHRLVMTYQAPGLAQGEAISLLALLLSAGLAWRHLRRCRTPPHGTGARGIG